MGRTPWSARDAPVPLLVQRYRLLAGCQQADGASAADQGVRPTMKADCPLLGILCCIGLVAHPDCRSEARFIDILRKAEMDEP